MQTESRRPGADAQEFRRTRPEPRKDGVPLKEKAKPSNTLSPQDHEKIVQFIVDKRIAMDNGLDETEMKIAMDSLLRKEVEMRTIGTYLDAIRSIQEEHNEAKAKQEKRGSGFLAGIKDTFSPIELPTVEMNGKTQNMQQLRMDLMAKFQILSLNIGRTPMPRGSADVSTIEPALRDAGIHMIAESLLKGMNVSLPNAEILALFSEADRSPELTKSETQYRTLQNYEDSLLDEFQKLKEEVAQTLNARIGQDKYGNTTFHSNRPTTFA